MSTPLEGSRDTGEGIIVSLSPDVCLTPVGSAVVPIPYSVHAIQADDANTCSTVRLTKLRAHNMGSLVTVTYGDEPGVALGVKSGTVASVCHPKEHSCNVNFEGKPAIRHNDQWFMNNRNTVGKLTYVKSTETFEPTPALELTHNPESLLEHGSWATDQSGRFPPGSYQVAQAGGAITAPPEFNRVAREPVISEELLKRLDRLSRFGGPLAASKMLQDWRARADANALSNSAQLLGLDMNDPTQAYLAWVHAHARHNFVSNTILSPLDNIPASGPARAAALEAITAHEAANPGSFEELLKGDPEAKEQYEQAVAAAVAAAPHGQTPGNVRITAVVASAVGICAALACPPPNGSGYRGGAHVCTSQPKGDGLDSHHMPADSVTAMPRDMGPAIQMEPIDHRLTTSYGGGARGPRYAGQRGMISRGNVVGALLMDAADARNIARLAGDSTRYDAAITQTVAYAKCLQNIGLLR